MNSVATFFASNKDVITGLSSAATVFFAWQASRNYKKTIDYGDTQKRAEEVMLAYIALRQSIDSARRRRPVKTRDPKIKTMQYNEIANAHEIRLSRFKI